MSRVRWPRRVWVGSTPTLVTAAHGTVAPPGTVSCVPKARAAPHMRPSSS